MKLSPILFGVIAACATAVIIFTLIRYKSQNPGIQKTAFHSVPSMIDLQPFNDVPEQSVDDIFHALKLVDSNVRLLPSLPLPSAAWYPPRQRYRADSLLARLSKRAKKGHTMLAIISTDISTTKGGHADWGVIGLGYSPGNACIVSSFRLSKKNTTDQWIKICLHELGHTRGLPHCKVTNCYMRDAEGHNVANELTEFCSDCAAKLTGKQGRLFTGG